MRITSYKHITTLIGYIVGLAFVSCLIPFLLAGFLLSSGPKVLVNLESIYKGDLILTAAFFIPSLAGYLLLRVFDCFRTKKIFLSELKKLVSMSISRFIHDVRSTSISRVIRAVLIEISIFFLAILLSLLIQGLSFVLIYILGWTSIYNFSNTEINIIGRLITCFLIAIREEFVFRFLIMSVLFYGIELFTSKKKAIVVSLLITSVAFSRFHFAPFMADPFTWYKFALALSAGAVLGIAYILTKSLVFSLGFHFGWNFFLGIIPNLGKFTFQNAPEWNSLLTILIIVFLMVPVFYYFKRLFIHKTHWLWMLSV